MTVFIVVLSYVLGGLAFYDAFRREGSDWVSADRSRESWLVAIGIMTVCAVGLFAAIAYAVYVLPGLQSARTVRDDFHKQA